MPSGRATIQLQTTSKTSAQLGRPGPQSPGVVHHVRMQQQPQHPQQQFYQQQYQQYPQGHTAPAQQPHPHQQYQHDVIEPTAVKPQQQFMIYGAPSPQPYQPQQQQQQQYQASPQPYQVTPQPYQPAQPQYQEEIVEPEIAKPAQQFMVYGAPPQTYQQQPQQQHPQPYQAAPQQHHQQHPQPQQHQPQQHPQPYQAAPQQHLQQHPQPQQHQPQQHPQPYQAAPQQHLQQHPQPQQHQPQQHPQPYQAVPQQQHQQGFPQHQQQQQQPQPYQAAPHQYQQSPKQQQQQQPQYHASPQPFQATPQHHHQAAPTHAKPQQLQTYDQHDSVPVNASPMPERGSPSTTYPPPHFVRPLGSAVTVSENEVVHLETQVEPAGDPSIQVEWIKDGRPIVAGSRFNTSYDRGYIVLDILSPMSDDSGHYSCMARSNSGQDQTNPITVTVLEEESVITSTQLPEESMMQNINNLENSWSRPRYSREDSEAGASKAPAGIARQLFGPQRVPEAGRAHFEARVTPPNDSTLQVDWFKDGHPLNSSCRFNVILDRGFVILDIASCIVEDSGDYYFVAKNAIGQVQSNVVHMTCVGGESVITRSVLPESTIDSLNQLDNPESHITHEFSRDGLRYEEESEPESPPAFVIQPSPVQAEEGNSARFLVKVTGNPMPKVQWLINDGIIGNSNQYHIFRDGAINYLEIRHCKDHGDTRVKVVAWNNNGQTETETFLRVIPSVDFRPGLKHVAPGSNFAKLNRLKKVECTPELAKALNKPRGPTETFRNVERFSEYKARTHKSTDVVEAEHLYTDVQSRLRPQERGLGGSAGYAAPPKGQEFSDI